MKESQRLHEMGAGGFCICPNCETWLPHGEGVPCQEERCPKCGAKMLRDGGYQGFVALEYEAAEDPWTAVPRHLAELRAALAA